VVMSCSAYAPSIYAQSWVSVNVNGQFTDFIKVLVGVRQGDPLSLLSPTLFGLFVEVLAGSTYGRALDQIGRARSRSCWGWQSSCFCNAYYAYYADDVVLIANDPDTLQAQLQALEQYCHDWDMDVNLSKTKVVVFRRPGQARLARTWQFAGRTVEVVDSYKYVGTVFHETKLLKQASQQMTAAGQRALPRSQVRVLPTRHHRPLPQASLLAAAGAPRPSSVSAARYGLDSTPSSMMPPIYMTNTPAEQVHNHAFHSLVPGCAWQHTQTHPATCCPSPATHATLATAYCTTLEQTGKGRSRHLAGSQSLRR
jgi:hypothetical protein